MKFLSILTAILIYATSSFVSAKHINNDDCKKIVDSATAFIQTCESAVNTKPGIKDNQRNLRLDRWLQQRSFKELRCLLDDQSIPLKATGFVYAAKSYNDSLMKYYSYLLSDTTTVQLIAANGNRSPAMKLGMLLSVMSQKMKEDKNNFARRPEIEEQVSKFITNYSSYPGTYKPYSFPHFSMGSDKEGLTGFKISHDYEMKNNDGKLVRVVNAFVFDKNLNLHVIEKDSSSYISSYPPKLGYWLKEFGRPLTNSDSLALRLR